MEKRRLLLINPSHQEVYKEVGKPAGLVFIPGLNLAQIASPLVKRGHEVRILDLNLPLPGRERLREELERFSPHYVGITATTPLFPQAQRLAHMVKEQRPEAVTILGGAHATSCPDEAISSPALDIIVRNEGDFALLDIMGGKPWEEIEGIGFKRNGERILNPLRPYLEELDSLPMPAWNLYDLKAYEKKSYLTLDSPTGFVETSRGCPFSCSFCNKEIFGRKFRPKTPERVVEEMEHSLRSGFRELLLVDDGFSTDLKRAEAICDEIMRRGLRFPWTASNGLRVDRVSLTLLKKMVQSGCYRLSFGLESGSQKVLDAFGKGATVEEAREAVALAKKAGLEIMGYFMLALPEETEETMKETIEFARELDLDIVKVAITLPFPGSRLFDEMKEKGLILSREWTHYSTNSVPNKVYKHLHLEWDVVERYQRLFYRKFYLRPDFILKHLFKSLKRGRLLFDLSFFLETKW